MLSQLFKNKTLQEELRYQYPDTWETILQKLLDGEDIDPGTEGAAWALAEDARAELSEAVDTFYTPGDDFNYPITIMVFEGLFWVRELEGEEEGPFDSKQEAIDWAYQNYSDLMSEDD